MTAAARADAKENSIAGLKPTKQAVIASYTRDHRAPTAALLKSPCRRVAADSLTPLRESELWTWDTPPGRGSHGFSNLGGR